MLYKKRHKILFYLSKAKMEYLERMKAIQNGILNFLDDENDQNLEDLVALFNYQKTQNDVHELKSILSLICKIIQNHHRDSFFSRKSKKSLKDLKQKSNKAFQISKFLIFSKKTKEHFYFLLMKIL